MPIKWSKLLAVLTAKYADCQIPNVLIWKFGNLHKQVKCSASLLPIFYNKKVEAKVPALK